MERKIKKVGVFVELDNGDVHQVGGTRDQFGDVLSAMIREDGGLVLHDRPEAFSFEEGLVEEEPKIKLPINRGYEC